jgi:A nuclease family of the HNH/ENDO VII superfamily with conserved AHH
MQEIKIPLPSLEEWADLISGSHQNAAGAREILADVEVRIDDPDNGCWMPKTKADARPTIYPNAVGHNRIHRRLYYHWIQGAISAMNTDGQVRACLNTVRMQLLQGNIKPEMKLQQEIDEAEYDSWLKKNRKL